MNDTKRRDIFPTRHETATDAYLSVYHGPSKEAAEGRAIKEREAHDQRVSHAAVRVAYEETSVDTWLAMFWDFGATRAVGCTPKWRKRLKRAPVTTAPTLSCDRTPG